MSVAMADCGISWHIHDPGVILTHLAVAMASGADCLSDMAVLKEQSELFGPVAECTRQLGALFRPRLQQSYVRSPKPSLWHTR